MSKKEKGLVDMDNSVVIAGGRVVAGLGEGWVKKVKGLSKKQTDKQLTDTDNSMVITRRKGGRQKRVKGG